MPKADDVILTCPQCGRQFVLTQGEQKFYERKCLTLPKRCPQCRSEKPRHPRYLICSSCGAKLDRETSDYYKACLSNVHLEYEQKTRECQTATDELQSKLLLIESEKSELSELLHQKERLIADLENKVSNLNQELMKMNTLQHGDQAAGGLL